MDDTNSTLDGSYALFVVDSGSVELRITIRNDGYYSLFDLPGRVVGNEVEYNGQLYRHNSNPIPSVTRNHERTRNINNLNLLRVDWGRNSGSSEYNYVLLAVVITKDEAVRYVQDGTLPNAMRGLTVTGLDEIFQKPDYEPGAMDEIRENLAVALVDFKYIVENGGTVII